MMAPSVVSVVHALDRIMKSIANSIANSSILLGNKQFYTQHISITSQKSFNTMYDDFPLYWTDYPTDFNIKGKNILIEMVILNIYQINRIVNLIQN
eukprot:UN09656